MDFLSDPNLALCLPLRELDGASFKSQDAYGHICTVSGALWEPHGRYFDGTDDYIDCGSAIVLSADFTVEAWIYRVSADAYHFVISQGVDGNYQRLYFRYNSDNTFKFGFQSDDLDYADVSPYGVDTWVHWAGTYNAQNNDRRLYKNGILVAGDTTTEDYQGTGIMEIGRKSGGGQPFMGRISEIRVYTRQLSSLEIQRNYLVTKWRYQ